MVRCEAPPDSGLPCQSAEVAADRGAIPPAAFILPADDAEQRTGRQALARATASRRLLSIPLREVAAADGEAAAEAWGRSAPARMRG